LVELDWNAGLAIAKPIGRKWLAKKGPYAVQFQEDLPGAICEAWLEAGQPTLNLLRHSTPWKKRWRKLGSTAADKLVAENQLRRKSQKVRAQRVSFDAVTTTERMRFAGLIPD